MNDVTRILTDHEERIRALEKHKEEVVRVDKIETRLHTLELSSSKLAGKVAGYTGAVTALIQLLFRFLG